MNNNNTLTEKYRPINIEDVVSHDLIKNTIFNYLDNKYLPNMLFYGKPGLGKTSLIISTVLKKLVSSLCFPRRKTPAWLNFV